LVSLVHFLQRPALLNSRSKEYDPYGQGLHAKSYVTISPSLHF